MCRSCRVTPKGFFPWTSLVHNGNAIYLHPTYLVTDWLPSRLIDTFYDPNTAAVPAPLAKSRASLLECCQFGCHKQSQHPHKQTHFAPVICKWSNRTHDYDLSWLAVKYKWFLLLLHFDDDDDDDDGNDDEATSMQRDSIILAFGARVSSIYCPAAEKDLHMHPAAFLQFAYPFS